MMAKKIKNICIITTERSGSTWLTELLSQHTRIKAFREPYRTKIKVNKEPRLQEITLNQYYRQYAEQTDGHQLLKIKKYLNQLIDQADENNIICFTVHYYHFKRYPELLFWLLFSNFRIVHLKRENSMENILSLAIRQVTKKSHNINGIELPNISVDAQKLVTSMKRHKKNKFIASLLLKCLPIHVKEISYEKILHRTNETIKELHEFAGLDKQDVNAQTNLKKVVNKDYADFITNYEELIKEMKKQKIGYYVT